MTPQTLLTELQTRGVTLIPEGSALRYRAPRGALTPDLRKALEEQKAAVMAALAEAEPSKDANSAKPERGILGRLETARPPTGPIGADLTTGSLCAVLLRSAVLDGALVWLVADHDALAAHPDIIRSGHALFFFDEIEQLQGKPPEELRAIAMVKTVFPTGRVLQ